MSSQKRYPKLRFALITEDALERLRPETKPQEPQQLMPVKDMYDTISNTVDTVVEQKLKHLKLDKLDQLIEAKIHEFCYRQRGQQRTMPSVQSTASTPTEDAVYTFSDRGIINDLWNLAFYVFFFNVLILSSIGFRKDTRSSHKVFKREPFATCYPYKTAKSQKRKTSVANP